MNSCFFPDGFLLRKYSMDLNQIWVGRFKHYGQLRIIFATIGSTPVPVAARSKAQVFGRSPAEVVDRIPPGAWMFVCCECCALSGRGLCDGLITRPKESYRLWHVVVCDQETSKTRRLKPATGLLKYNHNGM
jgi:hypothetical protein